MPTTGDGCDSVSQQRPDLAGAAINALNLSYVAAPPCVLNHVFQLTQQPIRLIVVTCKARVLDGLAVRGKTEVRPVVVVSPARQHVRAHVFLHSCLFQCFGGVLVGGSASLCTQSHVSACPGASVLVMFPSMSWCVCASACRLTGLV